MFANYLTITVRNLTRHKLYSLINIFGLSVGIVAGIIALIFIQHETSYDAFHTKADRTYRILRERGEGSKRNIRWLTSGDLARAIESDYPQIEKASKSRFYGINVRESGHAWRLQQGHIDANFLDIFDFPFVAGSRETAFTTPNTVVITENAAGRLFGDTDPIGKTITFEERYYGGDYTITGVLKQIPKNSSIQFDVLHQTEPVHEQGIQDWTIWQPRVQNAGIQTFVLLNNDISPSNLESILPDFIRHHMGDDARQTITYRLQPLLRWHLYSQADYGTKSAVDSSLMSAETSIRSRSSLASPPSS